MSVVLRVTTSISPVAVCRTASYGVPMPSAKVINSASPLARVIVAPPKATSAARQARVMVTKSANPAKATEGLVLMGIVASAWTEIVACGQTATVVATRKVATASLSCPAARQRTSNQSVHSPSLPKPSPVGGGFALLHLTD